MSDVQPSTFLTVVTAIRALIGGVLVLFYTFLLSVTISLVSLLGWTRGGDWVVFLWGYVSLKIFSIHLNVKGLENVPKDHGVLFLFNHQSHFDILSIHASQFRRMRFGAKIELFKFPFFGSAMRLSGVLPIARENREEVLQVYRDAQKKFAEGWSFILAPEGTRQSKPEIGRFKKGPFLFAIAAQVPIVPIVIKGADQILSKGGIWINMGVWSRTIEMRYLAPIETRGLTNADLGALTEQVREIFVKAYAEIPQPQAII